MGRSMDSGANMATTLGVSKDVKVNGAAVAKKQYSVGSSSASRGPGPRSSTLVRNSSYPAPGFGSQPDSVPRHPHQVPFTEALTWSFSGIRSNAVALAMDWGMVRVPLEIEVTPSLTLTYAAEKSGPYLGTYTFAWSGGPEAGKSIKLFVTHENGHLMGRWDRRHSRNGTGSI